MKISDLYGFPKVANEGEVDLTQISAAEYLAAVQEAEQGQEVDLTQISAAEYLAAVQEAEQGQEQLDLSQLSDEQLVQIVAEEEQIEKMASDGTLQQLDVMAQIVAERAWEKLTKIAQEENLPDYIPLDRVSAADANELINSGEYELVSMDSLEKEAGFQDRIKALTSSTKNLGSQAKDLLSFRQSRDYLAGRGHTSKMDQLKGHLNLLRGKGVENRNPSLAPNKSFTENVKDVFTLPSTRRQRAVAAAQELANREQASLSSASSAARKGTGLALGGGAAGAAGGALALRAALRRKNRQ